MAKKVADEQEMKTGTLTFHAQIPVSGYEEKMKETFEKEAVTGRQGFKTTVMIEDGLNSAYVLKKYPLSKWIESINTVEGESYQKTIGPLVSMKSVKKAAALHLASSVTKLKHHLKHVTTHELGEKEVIDADVGASSLGFNKERKRGGGNKMVYEAKISMPPEFEIAYERFRKTAKKREDSGLVMMGDHVSGKIYVSREDNGKWLAIGQGDYDYEREFSKKTAIDEIIHEVAKDMASNDLGKDVILNHIRRHGLIKDNIEWVKTTLGGVVYERPESDDNNGNDLGPSIQRMEPS